MQKFMIVKSIAACSFIFHKIFQTLLTFTHLEYSRWPVCEKRKYPMKNNKRDVHLRFEIFTTHARWTRIATHVYLTLTTKSNSE